MSTFKVERNTGYTVMSNHHLRNKNLSLKAKGLLSQMLSLPDDWDYTLRGLAFINKESIDAIRTAVLELEKAGYITRRQGRDEKGKLSAIEYTIYEYPQKQKPCLENPNTDSEPSLDYPCLENPNTDSEPSLDYPCLENPNTDKPNTEKPTSENPTQLNIDKRKKDISNTDVSNTHSFPFIPVSHENENSRRFEKKRNEMNEINKYRDLIKSNIEYDIMCSRYDANEIDELVDLMTETVCTTKDTVRVAGNDYPAELVKSKFLKLDSTHIEFVLDCMRENTSKVKNIRQYLLTVTLYICKDCGDFYTETTPIGSHHYHTKNINPTCQSVGYTEHTCEVCGDTYITDIQPLVSHAFERITKVPTCTDKGYTTSTCAVCGFSYVSDYTDATGHDWDEGHTVTNSTCEGEGVIEYHCKNCDEKMIKSTSANGHRAGTAATCTEPQICEDCGTILQLPKGHTYESRVIAPTCTEMGYTIYRCKDCGDTYTGDYTDKIPHHYHTTVTNPTCTSHGYTTYTCVNCCDEYVSDYTEKTPHRFKAAVTAPTCTEFGFTTYTCEDCGESYVSDYTDKTPHNYNKQIVEPTCTEHGYTVYTCPDCGNEYIGDITDCEQHKYKETVIAPTCTEMGYSIFTCESCGDEYKGNYTDKIPHSYKAVITNPTCTAFGFTTFTCENCGDSYVSDYTDKLEHDYEKTVTAPTCTESGHTEYKCKNCELSFVADYTDKIPHNYTAKVTNPTCSSHGYTTYTCDACGDEYVSDYTEKAPHNYKAVITNPTCTELGFTTYICEACGKSYISDYTDKTAHDYTAAVTAPKCTEMGFTTYTCKECGHSYIADYTDMLGHTLSDWIIDVDATIERSGSKHIECTVCGENLKNVEIPQLADTDRTDEDGNAKVGKYAILISDKNGIPVFNSEIVIDVNDKISISLPSERLLDYADPTTVTVLVSETQQPAENLNIYIGDANGNNATGKTNTNGQVIFPNNSSNTGDDNGTIGKDNETAKETYVVRVTDRLNTIIPDCDIYLGESNNIVVDLPDGVRPTREEPVIIIVTDQNGAAQKDVTVIALGNDDYIEKGKTDIYGRVTLPITDKGYTDDNGKVNVEQLNVIVNDETELIPNAYVVHSEDGTISVTLPDGKSISYDNRITVTVLDSMGKAVSNISVTVSDKAEKTYTADTDGNGRIVVPPVNEDITDNDGDGVVNGHNVNVSDETGTPIENAFITIDENGKIKVELPEEIKIDIEKRIVVIISDKDGKPEKDISVTVTDKDGKEETNLTDENGKAVVPPTNIDYTDINGYGELDGYSVTVENADGAIEKAYLEYDRDNGNIVVTLPESIKIDDYRNRVIITVLNKADNTPAKDIDVTVKETAGEGEPKTANGTTDKDGRFVTPPLNEDITDNDGNSGVTETTTQDGKDTDGDGEVDTPSETVTTEYKVTVSDTTGIITNAFVKIENGKVYVTLPDGKTLTTSNQTTVTVNTVSYPTDTTKYTDIKGSYWAIKDISYATSVKWLKNKKYGIGGLEYAVYG